MKYPLRYCKNQNTFTKEECDSLAGFKVLVAGCGGLGGYIIEHFARLGVGNITAVDYDVFEESNLNRQLFCTEELLGTSKAEAAALRIRVVNSDIRITPLIKKITGENAREIIRGHDLVIDALDNIESRFILEEACQLEGITMVHGAIGGWYGQVAVIIPGQPLLKKIYGSEREGLEKEMGNPAFTPGVIAGLEVAEAVKILLGKTDKDDNPEGENPEGEDPEGENPKRERLEVDSLTGNLLMVDLLKMEFEIISFDF